VQRAAANALGNCAYRDATPRLIEMVASPFEPVQRAAITSLGKIGDPRAVEVLKGCLYNTSHGYHDSARAYSEEPSLNETAAEALAAIGTPEALVALNEWRKARSTSG
jgi:HEAT repeat protein